MKDRSWLKVLIAGFGRKQNSLTGTLLLLEAMQDALTQQRKSCSPIHHSLDQLDTSHLPFCLRVVVGVR